MNERAPDLNHYFLGDISHFLEEISISKIVIFLINVAKTDFSSVRRETFPCEYTF